MTCDASSDRQSSVHRLRRAGTYCRSATVCARIRPMASKCLRFRMCSCTGIKGTTAVSPMKNCRIMSTHKLVNRPFVRPPKSSPVSPMKLTFSCLNSILESAAYSSSISSVRLSRCTDTSCRSSLSSAVSRLYPVHTQHACTPHVKLTAFR